MGIAAKSYRDSTGRVSKPDCLISHAMQDGSGRRLRHRAITEHRHEAPKSTAEKNLIRCNPQNFQDVEILNNVSRIDFLRK